MFATMPVGALLAGVLATALGIRNALWILTALIAASGIKFLLTPMRRLHNLPGAHCRSLVYCIENTGFCQQIHRSLFVPIRREIAWLPRFYWSLAGSVGQLTATTAYTKDLTVPQPAAPWRRQRTQAMTTAARVQMARTAMPTASMPVPSSTARPVAAS